MSQAIVLILKKCFQRGTWAVVFVCSGLSTVARAQNLVLPILVEPVEFLETEIEIAEPRPVATELVENTEPLETINSPENNEPEKVVLEKVTQEKVVREEVEATPTRTVDPEATAVKAAVASTQSKKKAQPKKITPSDVFARVELIKRKLDQLLVHRGVSRDSIPSITLREKGLKPMHIYQLHVMCLDQLRKFERSNGLIATPLIVSTPAKYGPGDVYQLSVLMSERIDRAAKLLGVAELPLDIRSAAKKSPTDVYTQIVPVLVRLLALNNTTKVTPSEVFSQVVRVRQDAQAIISTVAQANSARPTRRRHLQAKAFGMSADGNHLELDQTTKRTPAEAYDACIAVRRTINEIWSLKNVKVLPLPVRQTSEKILPGDVFLQTQMIIAELNLLKLVTNTTTATPPTDVATGKVPAQVRAEALWSDYILQALLEELSDSAASNVAI